LSLTASNLESNAVPPLGEGDGSSTEVKSLSPLRLAWNRFRKDKLSMLALGITIVFIVVAIASPILVFLGVLNTGVPSSDKQGDVIDLLTGQPLSGPTFAHPFGVEPFTGRDIFSRVMLGATISLTIALTGALLTVLVGTVLGIIAGFSGGLVDGVVGRLIDLTLSFPSTLMLLALSAVVVDRMQDIGIPNGPNGAFVNGLYIVLVLSLFGWPPVARLIRGQVLSLREREYVDAAVLMGSSRARIYFKEILPNLWAPLLVYFTLLMPAYVSAEAALSYLSVGIKNPTPTLGNVLNAALPYVQSEPLYFFAPAIFIAAIVVSFNLLGDGARDALDPRSGR